MAIYRYRLMSILDNICKITFYLTTPLLINLLLDSEFPYVSFLL